MPNPHESWEELIYWTSLNLKLTGNCYWLRDEMNGKGQPAALYPLLTANMKAVPDAVKKVSAYEYAVSGKTVKYAAEEIIHFRRPKPDDFIFGMGDVEASSTLFEGLINRAALEERFISNGAQPSGILTRKDTAEIFDESQWEALKARFNSEYGGRRNAGKIAFLNGAWDFVRLALNHQEMQAYERERWAIEQVFVAHGVPLSVAGLSAASNYATARVEDINFRRYTCVPVLKFIASKLNGMNGLARAFGDQFRVRFDLSGLVDVEQVGKDYGPLVAVGAMTPNELREKAGLPRSPDPLLDAFYIDNDRVPLELAGMAGAIPAEPIN
jgi:HK97 family phage portal protein